MTKINLSSPQAFVASLRERAATFADSDFRSLHDHTVALSGPKPVSPSGNWGGVPTCVAVARKDGVVAVRNSNDPDKITAVFSQQEWEVFVTGVKAGKFD